MASKLASALGSDDKSDATPARSPITTYKIAVKDDDNGVPVFRLLAKRADGTGSKYGNLFVWLDQPHAARALRASLASIAKALDVIDAEQVKNGSWPAAPKPAASEPAATKAPAASAAPTKSADEAALEDFPF